GTLLDHPPRLVHGPRDRVAGIGHGPVTQQQTVAREGVRREVEDAHDIRAGAPAEGRRADRRRGRGRCSHRRGPGTETLAHGSGSRNAGSSTSRPRTSPTRYSEPATIVVPPPADAASARSSAASGSSTAATEE